MSAMVELAMASYLSLYPALLLPPMVFLCRDRNAKVPFSVLWSLIKFSTIKLVGVFIGAVGALLLLSFSLVGTWDFLASTYGVMYHPL